MTDLRSLPVFPQIKEEIHFMFCIYGKLYLKIPDSDKKLEVKK